MWTEGTLRKYNNFYFWKYNNLKSIFEYIWQLEKKIKLKVIFWIDIFKLILKLSFKNITSIFKNSFDSKFRKRFQYF